MIIVIIIIIIIIIIIAVIVIVIVIIIIIMIVIIVIVIIVIIRIVRPPSLPSSPSAVFCFKLMDTYLYSVCNWIRIKCGQMPPQLAPASRPLTVPCPPLLLPLHQLLQRQMLQRPPLHPSQLTVPLTVLLLFPLQCICA